jgi:hypothetical protein
MKLSLVLLTLAVLSPLAFVRAEEDDVVIADEVEEDIIEDITEDEDEAPIVASSDDAQLTVVFPDYGDDVTVPAGSIVTAVVGIHNKGSAPFVVTSIDGGIKTADFSESFQNFTALPINIPVDASGEATFTYRFMVSDRFDPNDFGMDIDVHFQDMEENQYVASAYNGPLTITETVSHFDLDTLLGYVILAGIVGAGYFATVGQKKPAVVAAASKKTAKKLVAQVETGTKKATTNEWLVGTNFTPKRK